MILSGFTNTSMHFYILAVRGKIGIIEEHTPYMKMKYTWRISWLRLFKEKLLIKKYDDLYIRMSRILKGHMGDRILIWAQ